MLFKVTSESTTGESTATIFGIPEEKIHLKEPREGSSAMETRTRTKTLALFGVFY